MRHAREQMMRNRIGGEKGVGSREFSEMGRLVAKYTAEIQIMVECVLPENQKITSHSVFLTNKSIDLARKVLCTLKAGNEMQTQGRCEN